MNKKMSQWVAGLILIFLAILAFFYSGNLIPRNGGEGGLGGFFLLLLFFGIEGCMVLTGFFFIIRGMFQPLQPTIATEHSRNTFSVIFAWMAGIGVAGGLILILGANSFTRWMSYDALGYLGLIAFLLFVVGTLGFFVEEVSKKFSRR